MKTGVVNCITVKGNTETLVFIVYFRLFTFTSILLLRIVWFFFCPAALNYMKGYPRSINYGKGTLIHVLLLLLLLLTLATESFTAVVIITSNVYHV